jgi:hypothetical protein
VFLETSQVVGVPLKLAGRFSIAGHLLPQLLNLLIRGGAVLAQQLFKDGLVLDHLLGRGSHVRLVGRHQIAEFLQGGGVLALLQLRGRFQGRGVASSSTANWTGNVFGSPDEKP